MAATKNKSELEVKILEVQQWLASLSGDLKNEPYEIDEYTVEYLYQLCQLNKKKDNHLELMIKDNADKSEEYSIETDRITKELQAIGVCESGLSTVCVEALSDLANTGFSLALSNPALETYLVNLSDHTTAELELKDKLKQQEVMISTLSEKLENLEVTISKLNAECEEAENMRRDDEIDLPVEIETAKAQAQHYVESTKEFKKLLSASGIKKEYTHENLQKMSEKVATLSAEIEQTNKRIAEFKELPPSIPLAKEKIRQIKIEIETVEQEFPELACVS